MWGGEAVGGEMCAVMGGTAEVGGVWVVGTPKPAVGTVAEVPVLLP